MFKLFERLPDGITHNGKRYACNFDFRNVLKMMEVMQRTDLTLEARDFLCLKCVMRKPRDVPGLYDAVCNVLFDKQPAGGERVTSFEQDAGLIRAAFRQVYGINLFTDSLSWFEFTELLQNLPEGNRYEDVIGIRSRPLPAPTKYNAKEREWLIKAKQQYALRMTDAEAARKYDRDVLRLFKGLMSMLPEDVKRNE